MNRPSRRTGFSVIEILVVIAVIAVILALILAALLQARATADRIKCQNNLHQIGIALRDYHDAQGAYPPALSQQMPYWYLGWQARLLPFIDHDDYWQMTVQAYQQSYYPWNNPPHVILGTELPLYVCPSDFRAPLIRTFRNPYIAGYPTFAVAFTSYLGVEGTNCVSRDGVLYQESAVKLTDIKDGLGYTITVGERPPSNDFVFGWWYAGAGQGGEGSCDVVLGTNELNYYPDSGCTNPGPFNFGPGNLTDPCNQFHFWSLHSGGGNFLFADAQVRFLPYSAAPIIPALGTRAGGESMGDLGW